MRPLPQSRDLRDNLPSKSSLFLKSTGKSFKTVFSSSFHIPDTLPVLGTIFCYHGNWSLYHHWNRLMMMSTFLWHDQYTGHLERQDTWMPLVLGKGGASSFREAQINYPPNILYSWFSKLGPRAQSAYIHKSL